MTESDSFRAHYGTPSERAQRKVLKRLDRHCLRFLQLSPLVCLGTQGPSGGDVSPRGDEPGFAHALDERTLAIPDWPGNNRLDSLGNIEANPLVGLLFLIPGVDETLRVNGRAHVSTEAALLGRWDRSGRRPISAIVVEVDQVFFHCGRALIRSAIWKDTYRVERSALPTYGTMLKDQVDTTQTAAEIDLSVNTGYRDKLY